MPNLVLLGNSALVLFGIAMVLWDFNAAMIGGFWRPESLGDWLDGAHIHV